MLQSCKLAQDGSSKSAQAPLEMHLASCWPDGEDNEFGLYNSIHTFLVAEVYKHAYGSFRNEEIFFLQQLQEERGGRRRGFLSDCFDIYCFLCGVY